jgi:predicted nucleic acid-binding protein
MRYLFDVNVLIALLDARHPAHAVCHVWYGAHTSGTAICPLVENGAARIMSSTAYAQGQPSLSAAALLQRLARMRQTANDLAFWPDSISLADPARFDHGRILGPRQLTDIYLLGLAVANQGGLVTLDRNIPLSAVRGAVKAQLLVL